MKIFFDHKSLRFRLLIANVLIMMILGFFIVLVVRNITFYSFLGELRQSRFVITTHVAESVIDPVLARKELNLRATLIEHKETITDAEYVFIADEKGQVLAYSFEQGFPVAMQEMISCNAKMGRQTGLVFAGKQIRDISVPLLGGSIGELHIGFSEEQFIADAKKLIAAITVIVLIAVLLQILLTVIFDQYITRPITQLRNLADQVQRIGRGEPAARIEIASSDEVGRLAVAYNIMRDDLQRLQTERESAGEKLRTYQNKLRSLASELLLAEERERRRVAVDLHDHIGVNLALSKIKLGSLRDKTASTALAGDVVDISVLLEKVIEDTRLLIFELSPPILYEMGFEAAAEWLCDQMRESYGLVVSFEDDGLEKTMEEDLRVLLFRILRELLFNVVKHAGAKNVNVIVSRDDNNIKVEVVDDGIGFDSSLNDEQENVKQGFGLFSIRERLDYLGGRMEIVSQPGKGTHVTVTAPLAAAGQGEKRGERM